MIEDNLIKEFGVLHNLITNTYPTGMVSVVCDTYDYWGVITHILPRLKDIITGRDGKLICRPDSGHPVRIVTGYTESEIVRKDGSIFTIVDGAEIELTEHEVKGSIQCLWDIFGGSTNTKGFKELDPHIGLIYGDAITYQVADEILTRLKDKGYASNNVVFGQGSWTYTGVSRDTHGMAVKSTAIMVGDDLIELYKDPKTDDGTKKSAKGLMLVSKTGNEFTLKDQCSPLEESRGVLETVFEDGKMIKETSLQEIRDLIKTFD